MLSMIFKPHTHALTRAQKREIHQPPARFYFPGLTSISIQLHWLDGSSGQMAPTPLVSQHAATLLMSRRAARLDSHLEGQMVWGRRRIKKTKKKTHALSARRYCSASIALQCAFLGGRGQWYSLMPPAGSRTPSLGGQAGFCFHCYVDASLLTKETSLPGDFHNSSNIHIYIIILYNTIITMVTIITVIIIRKILNYHHY